MFVAEFQYACFSHTLSRYFLRQYGAQVKEKVDVDLPN